MDGLTASSTQATDRVPKAGHGRSSVVVDLFGGVGNQLFQYATGLGIAQVNGAAFGIRSQTGAATMLLAELLGACPDPATSDQLRDTGVEIASREPARTVQRLRRKILMKQGRIRRIDQHHDHAFAPASETHWPGSLVGVHLHGYFQHPTWFEATLRTVALNVYDTLRRLCPDAFDLSGTVVSLRRGDYVQLGWALPLSYYEQALEQLESNNGPIWVVGDDPMASEALVSLFRSRGVRVGDPRSLGAPGEVRDLAMLAAAQQVIMANSTFSWWGVTAGESGAQGRERQIITPAEWLPVAGSEALLRPGWTRAALTETS